MSSNGSSSNQTTTSQAPSWQLPYQQYGVNQSQAQYNNVTSPTQLVAPFSPQQNEAISNIDTFANSNMLGGGSPMSGFVPGGGRVGGGYGQPQLSTMGDGGSSGGFAAMAGTDPAMPINYGSGGGSMAGGLAGMVGRALSPGGMNPMSGTPGVNPFQMQPGSDTVGGGIGVDPTTHGTTYNGQPVGQNNLPPGWSYQNGNVYGPQRSPNAPMPQLGFAGGGAPAPQYGGGSPGGGAPLPSLNNWATGVLNGSPANNPYLNSEFNQAANQTQDRLASEFAGSGRSVTGSMPLRSDELNNLATSLYGGAYNTGVQEQESAGSMVPGIVNSELGLQGGLFNTGQQVQNQAQQYITAPQTFLNQYLARVNGNLGTTTTTPVYYNNGMMALGGANLGSSLGQGIGSAIGGSSGGSWGSGIGGLLGALGGYFGGGG